jgi:tetratricopeptide (TPR) repeat protein
MFLALACSRFGRYLILAGLTTLVLASAPAAVAGESAAYSNAVERGNQIKLERFTAALAVHPHDPVILESRAALHMHCGQFQLALTDLNDALAHIPANAKMHATLLMGRGQCLEHLGQDEAAARDIENYYKIAPDLARFHEQWTASESARILLRGGHYPGCIKCVDTDISFGTRHALAFAARSLAYALTGKTMQATADLVDTLRLKIVPSDLAKRYSILNQKVIDICRKRAVASIKAGPKNISNLFAISVVEAVDSHFDRAIAAATAVIDASPNFYEAFIVRGMCRVSEKQNDDALKDINHGLRLQPKNPVGYKALEAYYITVSGVDQLLEDVHRRQTKDPNNIFLLMTEARAYQLMRNLDKERGVCDRVLALNPAFVPALIARGELTQGLGDMRAASQFYSRALAQEPDNPVALKDRAECYLELEDYARALIDLNRLIKVCNDPSAYVAREKILSKRH